MGGNISTSVEIDNRNSQISSLIEKKTGLYSLPAVHLHL